MLALKDKVCLVTGAATGLGRAISEELLRNGASISICDLDSDAGMCTSTQFSNMYGKHRVIFCHCDVTDYSQFEEAFQTTKDTFGYLDIVVNNVEIMNDKFWELEVDVNLNGVIRGIILANQFMSKERGNKGGTIINIGSYCSVKPYISTPIYTATKHAILGLTKSYGDAFHNNLTGIKVIAYCVGPIESSSSAHRFKSPSHERAWKLDMAGVHFQKVENVAKELIPVLLHAQSGSLWMINNDKKPMEIPYSSYNY